MSIVDSNFVYTVLSTANKTLAIKGLNTATYSTSSPNWPSFPQIPLVYAGTNTVYNGNGNPANAYKIVEISDYAFVDKTLFAETTLSSTFLGSNLTKIGDGAFHGVKLKGELVIPQNIMSVGFKAFYNCTLITKITIGSETNSEIVAHLADVTAAINQEIIDRKNADDSLNLLKAPIDNPTFTGITTIPSATITNASISSATITNASIAVGTITSASISTLNVGTATFTGSVSVTGQWNYTVQPQFNGSVMTTEVYVNDKFSAILGGSTSSALDTLSEIANAISNDPSFATTVTTGHIALSSAISKEVSDRIVAVSSLSSALSSAVSTLTGADTSLSNALAAEVTTRAGSVVSVSSLLSSAVSTLTGADTSLTNALAAEVTTRSSAVVSVSTLLSSAVSTLTAADTSLSNALAAEVTTRSSAVVSHSSGLSSAVSTLTAADTSLTNALAAEVSARSSAVVSHSSGLSSAVSTLTAADTSLTNALAAEVSARSSAVVSHSSALSSTVSSFQVIDNLFSIALVNEISTRIGSVASISSALSSAVSTLTAADTILTESITNEVSNRVAAVTSLSTSVHSAVSSLTSVNSVQLAALNSEIGTRSSQVVSITTLMTASVASLTTANATITAAITAEVGNRSSAIATAITNIIGNAPSAFDTLGEIANELTTNPSLSLTTSVLNQVVSMAAAITSEVSTRSSAVVSHSSGLSSAVSTLTAADTSLTNALAAEVSARSSAVVSHSSGLSSAVSTLTAADTSLTNALAAEVSARSSAVVSHSSALSSAVSTLTAADTSLTNALATEVSTRSGSVVSVSTTLYNVVSSIALVNSAQATALATEVTTRSSAVVSISTAFANASASFHAIDSTLATSIVSLVSQVALKANKTYLDSVISQVVGNAPTNLDTLYEIAAALNNNNNFAGSITTVLATKADATSVSALATTLATKANQSDLTSLSTLVDTKAATATVSTMQINVNNLTNSKDTLVTQVNNLITTGGNVNSSNVGVNGVTLTDLATRAQELYYKFGYVNGDGTINYKINVLDTPTLVTSWLEFVLDANYDVTSVNHKATVKFDKYQTNVQYGALNVVSTINNISLNSNFQHTFTATYVGGPNEYNQNATNMYITSLESPIRMAPTSPMLTIVPPELGTTTNVSQSGQSVSLFIWNPLYKQYLLTRSEYAATTWSDATGLITQPVTIQTDSGSVLKFDTGTYTGVTIELFNNATLVSDKTFSTTAASSTYLVKYDPSVVNPPGIISVSYSTNYISFTLEQSVYDDILSDTKFRYISAASMAIDTPYQAAFTDLPTVYWMSPSYATSAATVLQSRTQSFVVTPTTTILGKRLRFNNHARSFGNLQNQYYWDNHKQFVDIRSNGTVENHVGAISVRVLNSASKIGSDPLTIVNVFNDYAQYAAPTMVANSKTVSKSGAAYTYTATFTNADGAAMQVLNADNSVASAQPTVNVAYSYPTTYNSSKIGQPIFKINVPTSGSKRASTYLVINGEDIAAHATPVLSGSVAYAGTAGAYTATATYTFNANVSAVKVMKSDGSTIIASQSVSAGTATLVIPYNDASIGMTYNVVALANDTGTQSASSSQVALMYPSSPVSTDTNVALKMLSKIQGPPLSSIGYSRSVAVNQTTGNIYVAALNNHNILVLNRAGNFMFKIGGAGSSSSANGEFNSPEGIAVDTYGNIYVADTTNHRVQIFDNTGRFMLKFGSNGTDNGQFTRPTGIAILSDGKICVSDTGNNRVQVFDSIGTFVFKIGGATTATSSADGEFNTPLGITVDSENNIIVADVSNNRIQVFNSTGTFMCKFGSYGTGNLNLIGPQGVAVDTTGKILVSDTDNSRIQVLSRTGNTISYVRTIGSHGASDAQFQKQRGIAVDADNNIIIANTNENNIKIFKNDGTFSFKITGPLFNGINGGVALDTTGNIWVADTTNNVVKKFTSAGIYVSQVGSGSSGTGNGQFSTPYGIGINMQTGYLYISDLNNNRVQIFTSAGTYVNQFGSYGTSNGQFSLPRGVAVDAAGNIYVADTNNNRIQKFTSVGAHALTIGTVTAGTNNGQFNSPRGVAVDAAGNIYVADANNNRIQKFDSTGAHTLTIGTVTAGSANGLFNRPSAISVDMNGNIIVLDSDNNRFQIFNSAGNYVRQFGSNGTGNGQFAYPTGIALNAAGNIVVVDTDNLRIQIIGPTPDLELDANNGVTIKFIGNSSTVLSTAPKFVYANPRGTGSEWFAVVDSSTNAKNMIVNYAANLLSGTGRTYFTNGANGVVAFNNIVTTLMTDMYALCSTQFFNEPIASWDTSNVNTMNAMFRNCDTFNQPISNWNTANVNNMAGMFGSTKEFNQYIGSWNTINVTIMTTMFSDSRKFNKPIGLWNTSNVTMMIQMFEWSPVFNQPIGSWNTVNVIYMDGMFKGASVFNQNISTWNVANVSPNPPLFFNTSSGSISVANLPKWAPVLSNFTVGTKALADGAFAITAPTSTVATTYGSVLSESFTPSSNASYANNTMISADGTMLGLSIPSSTGTIRMYSYAAPATYTMNAISAGISRHQLGSGNLIGIANGKKGTMSIWCKFTDASTNQNIWLSRDNWSTLGDTFYMQSNNGYVRLAGRSSQGVEVLFATTSTQPCNVSGTWHHIFASWDLNVLNRVNVWVNGVAQTLTITTFVTGGTIHYDTTNHGIGLTLNDPILPTNLGLVGQVYVNFSEYVDPATNIGKFYDTQNKRPIYLGANGAIPTGNIPIVHLDFASTYSSTTIVNSGTGGNFISYTLPTSTTPVKIEWVQLGGDIIGPSGSWSGTNGNFAFNFAFAMSADGKTIAVGESGLGGSNPGTVSIYKYDSTRTTAQNVQGVANYGPIGWKRIAQLSGSSTIGFGWLVAMSADANTLAVSAVGSITVYAWDGTNWTTKGSTITGPYNDAAKHSMSISADGQRIIAASGSGSYFNDYAAIYADWNSTGTNNWSITAPFTPNFQLQIPSGRSWAVVMSADKRTVMFTMTNNADGADFTIYKQNETTGVWALVGNKITIAGETGPVSSTSINADGTMVSMTLAVTRNGRNGSAWVYRFNGTDWVNVCVIPNRIAQNTTLAFNAMLSADGSRLAVGGLGIVSAYDLITAGKITYASSTIATAVVYGNLVLMKAVGTSTITASQTTATGTGTITSTLTVIPPFATPVLSNKVFALTATPGAYTFTATVTVEAAVAQIKIVKLGAADTILSVTGGSVSISMSYATADVNTSFYVVAVANSTAEKGQSNPVSQTFLEPPPVLSNFAVGAKNLADGAFVLTAPTSTSQIAHTENSLIPVGQSFTGLPTADWNIANLVRISADGTAIGIVLGTSAGTVRMYKLIDNGWTQWGGDITGTANGLYAGVSRFDLYNSRSLGSGSFSMSADGTLLTTVQTGLGGVAGLLNIYKYDVNKTTAQTTNAALPTYGPIHWSRVATMQLLTTTPSVVISADGKTIAVSDNTLIMYRSDDGGATWTQKGGTITDTEYNSWFFRSISISANGLAVVAAPTKDAFDAAKFMCYEWDGTTWNASFIRDFSRASISNYGAISADGKVCVIQIDGVVHRYTKNVSGVWTLAVSLNFYKTTFQISTSADGTFISFGAFGNSPTHGDAEIHRWNGSTYVPVIRYRTIQNRTTDSMKFNTMLSADGTRVAVGGKGKVDVYDLVATSKTAYTSSAPAVASVHGNLVLMKAAGTSTITAIQTNAAGSSAPITDTLTVFTWTLRTSIAGYYFRSLAYGNGTWVAVSPSGDGNNKVMTSIDGGFNWTSVSVSGSPNYLMSVAYGNGSNGNVFVAVSDYGTGNRVWTSLDGVTWTNRNSAADNGWTSVAYSNGLWVAVANTGAGNRVMTSSDGSTWTSRTSAADNNWNSVAYGNGLWVAVATTGTGNRVMTSPDGITWTSRTSAADNNWNSVAYGNGLWVAVANNGTGNRLMTSPDGITWTPRTVADNGWTSVAYGNGLWVAISSNGSRRVMTSPDGIAWTSEISAGDYGWSSVAYGNGTWVVISSDGSGKVMTSAVLPPAIQRAGTVSSGSLSTLSTIGSPGTGNGQLAYPYGVATDAAGNIYVADQTNHRIQIFNSAGTHVSSFGSQGTGNGQFNAPRGIAIGADGNIYVSDGNNHRIQVFTSNGAHIITFGSVGSGDGQFNYPRGIAITSSGKIIVSEGMNRIQVFSSTGVFISKFGTGGTGNGQFDAPFGIAIGADGNIYVADLNNNRIQMFTSDGVYISKFGTVGAGNGQFSYPAGIAIDASGKIVVSDTGNSRIQVFTSAGTHVSSFGSQGTGNGQFQNPQGLAIDASGKILVADSVNHRIQIVGGV